MKKNYFSLLLIATALFLYSCGPSKDDAVKWNDLIVGCEDEVSTAVDAFTSAIDIEGADLNKECDKAIVAGEVGLTKMKNLPDFKDGAEFKAAGIESLTLFESLLKNEGKQIAALLSNPNATEADFEKVKEHLGNTITRIDAADAKFIAAQKAFGDKWGLELTK
jgi:hypothetical protein